MKAPHRRPFSSKSDQGRNAELCLVARLNRNPGTKAFRQPGSKGAGDVVEIQEWQQRSFGGQSSLCIVHVIQVKSGRKPSVPEITRLKARIRAEWPFPVNARVVWAHPDRQGHHNDGWEFVWL